MTVEEMAKQMSPEETWRKERADACRVAGAAWTKGVKDGDTDYHAMPRTHEDVGDGEGFRWRRHGDLDATADSLRYVYHCAWTGGSTRRATDAERDAFMRGAYEVAA